MQAPTGQAGLTGYIFKRTSILYIRSESRKEHLLKFRLVLLHSIPLLSIHCFCYFSTRHSLSILRSYHPSSSPLRGRRLRWGGWVKASATARNSSSAGLLYSLSPWFKGIFQPIFRKNSLPKLFSWIVWIPANSGLNPCFYLFFQKTQTRWTPTPLWFPRSWFQVSA